MSLPSEFLGAWRRDSLAIEVSTAAGILSAVKYQTADGGWVETGRVDTNV